MVSVTPGSTSCRRSFFRSALGTHCLSFRYVACRKKLKSAPAIDGAYHKPGWIASAEFATPIMADTAALLSGQSQQVPLRLEFSTVGVLTDVS